MFDELIFNRLTDEQKEFVNDFDHSILVSASAGTGKTTTMIRKLLYLLLVKKIDITNLLVVTYTTAAASKMKHDLFMGLQSAIGYAKDDEDMINHINNQIDLLNNADIGTIHSFCNKIIKKYFFELGVDPNYAILSNEKAKDYLLNNALDDMFEDDSVTNLDGFFKLYENFNNDRTDKSLRKAILDLYNYLICRIQSDKWISQKIEECYSEKNNPVWDYLKDYYKDKSICLREKFKMCYDLAVGCGHDKAKEFAVFRIDYLDKIINSADVIEIAKHINVAEIPRKVTVKTDKDTSLIDLKELVDLISDEFGKFKTKLEKIFGVFLDEKFFSYNENNKSNAMQLYILVEELQKRYKKVKAENNLLDFNDLEFYASKLCDNEQVVNELRDTYKYIFVDEYQDVNPMQETIISKLCKSNNLYMIGDVKQSIYKFRQSSPEIFLEKYNLYKSGINDKRVILFNKNFRSDANILYFVNNIFDKCITNKCVGVDYKNEARLLPGLPFETLNKSVDITLIDSNDLVFEDSDEDDADITKREIEAKLIATKVSEIVGTSEYKFKDIAILLRGKQELARDVWIALKNYNIPVSVTIKDYIFKSAEIIMLHSLLKCVYNEDNDIAFVTLLKSPFINCTNNELAQIKINAPDVKSFYEACLVCEHMQIEGYEKIIKLRNILKELRLKILSENIADVLRAFISEYDLLVYYKSMPDGVEKECHINEFINIVESQLYENDLARLLDYMELIKDNESEMTISASDDSVTLTTMHSSKGLDYPVVIIGGVGDNIDKKSRAGVKINKDFGVGFTAVDENKYAKIDNINARAIDLKNKFEDFEEEIRIMYVALTRPKKRLYITGCVDLQKVYIASLDEVKTYFDLILLSMSKLEQEYFINRKSNFVLNINNNCNVICNIVGKEDLIEKTTQSQIILDVSNPKIVTKLKSYYNTKLPDYSGVAFKNSVTSILREQEVDYVNAVVNFKKLTINESISQIDAMELGTQYHEVMRCLEYGNKNQDIKKLIDNLVLAGKLNAIYLDKIDVAKIEKAKEVINSIISNTSKIKQETNFLVLAPHNELIEGSDCEEKVLIQGIIDLVIEDSDGVIIVDYKTNRTKNGEYLIETYKTQLNLYAKAFELAYNKKVKAKYLYSFEMNELLEIK